MREVWVVERDAGGPNRGPGDGWMGVLTYWSRSAAKRYVRRSTEAGDFGPLRVVRYVPDTPADSPA